MANINLAPQNPLRFVTKTVTFDGSAGKGAVGNVPLFTITGRVVVVILVPYCTASLVGDSATLRLGVNGNNLLFIGATTATNIDVYEIWVDGVPTPNGIAIPAALKDIAIAANILGYVATANITAGAICFEVYWRPLSPDGNLEPA